MKQKEIKGRCKTSNVIQNAGHGLRSFIDIFIHTLKKLQVDVLLNICLCLCNEGPRVML